MIPLTCDVESKKAELNRNREQNSGYQGLGVGGGWQGGDIGEREKKIATKYREENNKRHVSKIKVTV